MPRVYVSDLGGYVGKEVLIKGWLYNRRSSGKIRFLQVRDGSGIVQCVLLTGQVPEAAFQVSDELPYESAVMVRGLVREDKRAPGGYEITVQALELVHRADDYPITLKEHGVAFLMEHRHLWLRSKRQQAILRIRAELIRVCREYFDSRGFLLLDAPIFTPTACEGTTTLFATDYFGEKAYLTQSGQLYMEAGAMAFGKVYCFGPTFRAEKSKTRRHLTEFWMLEPEVAYNDLEADMELAEDLLQYVVRQVVKNKREELEILERDISKLATAVKPFPRITYEQALKLLKERDMEVPWGKDLGGDEETVLSQQFDKPFFVYCYPACCKAFYMKVDPNDHRLALSMDVLAPEGYGEIIGGGQREEDLDILKEKIEEHNLPEDALRWYLDLRRYGSVPHAGFGLGIERVLAWICGLHHVRETIPFPRMMEKIWP